MVVVMFRITHNTIRRFSFAEILLMAAMNQNEAKRKDSAMVSNPERTS
jgi:hypothetical protein